MCELYVVGVLSKKSSRFPTPVVMGTVMLYLVFSYLFQKMLLFDVSSSLHWPGLCNHYNHIASAILKLILFAGLFRGMEIWATCRTFWPIFTTLVLLPIYFVYSSVSIYRTFTRFIGQCPAWLAVSIPLGHIL